MTRTSPPDVVPAVTAELTARDVMRHEVLVADATASVPEVWQAMHEASVEHAVVMLDGTCVGIVGLSELWTAWSLELRPAHCRSVLPLVIPSPCVTLDTRLPQLCRVLLRARFGAVMVLDDDGELQGLVTTADVLARLSEEGT